MGFSKEELNEGIKLQSYIDIVHLDDVKEFARKKHDSILKAVPFQNSHRLIREDSEPVWVTVHSRPCRVQDGLPTLISGIISLGREHISATVN